MNKVFIGSLSWNVREPELEEVFSKIGAIEDVKVITDRESGRSRGFAFVTFADPNDAQKAVDELDGTEIDGRQIVVKIARDKPQGRFGGGDEGSGGGRRKW